MEYEDWLEALDNALWSMLGDSLDDYSDANLEELFESGMSPEQVVYALYEDLEEEDDELEEEDGEL